MRTAVRLVVVVAVLLVGVVAGRPAWAGFGDGAAGGPEVLVTAQLNPGPSTPTAVDGCGSTAQQTHLALSWTDGQSSTLDAAGGYLVSGYTVSRAPAATGPWTTVASPTGAPPATSAADAPTVGAVEALIADGTTAGGKQAYALNENGATLGSATTIGTIGGGSPVAGPNAAQLTPTGTTAVVAEYSSNQVQVLTLSGTTWTVARTLNVTGPTAVAVDPVPTGAGAWVAWVVSDPGTGAGSVVPVTLAGAASSLGTAVPVGVQSDPGAVAVTPDGSRVVVANAGSGTVTVVATATSTATTVALTGTAPVPVALAVTPDSSHVEVADRANGRLDDVALAAATVSASVALGSGALDDTALPTGGDPNLLAMSPGGTVVWVAEFGGGKVQAVDTALSATPDTLGTSVSAGTEPIDLAMSPNGCLLYVADWPSNDVYSVNTQTDAVTMALTTTCWTQDPQPMAVTPDNAYLIIPESYECSDVQVLNTATDAVTTLTGAGTHPAVVAVAPVDVWYEVTAEHGSWSSAPPAPGLVPIGWDTGGWQ